MTTTLEEPKQETSELKPETTEPNNTPVSPPKSYATYPGVFYLDPATNKMERSYPTRILECKSYVAKSPIHGMGCFAKQEIKMGELIEECVAIITDTTTKSNTDFVINNYFFTWPCEFQDPICAEHGPTYFVPSGNSLIYNHSDTPNAYWIFDKAMKRIFMGALRDIKEGEEITWYYGHGYANKLRTQNDPSNPKPEGCGTCAARKKQMEEMNRNKNQPIPTQEKIEEMKREAIKRMVQNKSKETVVPNPTETETQFRSMVVPEKLLNDTPLT